MGVSGQHHASAALYPRGKDPRYPLYRRLGGPQSRSGCSGFREYCKELRFEVLTAAKMSILVGCDVM
jgi:hypothetical protein